jgi:uncharacterized protein YcbX
MGIDPKERFIKGDKVGNVQDRVSTSREKSTVGAPNLLTAGELQLASDTNAGGNALSLAHCKFAGVTPGEYCYAPAVVVIAGEFAMRQE